MLGMNWLENYLKAGNRETSKDDLKKLANDSSTKIRMRVAENEFAPLEVLEYLSADADADVRSAVATNSAAPARLVEILANDADATVRHAIAENPSTLPSILVALSADGNPYVACRARKTLRALDLLEMTPQESSRLNWLNVNQQVCTN